MTLEELAKKLIEEVSGDPCEEHITGVIDVFRGIMTGVNNQWEQHLAKQTNEILMYDYMRCHECATALKVIRTRDAVNIKDY